MDIIAYVLPGDLNNTKPPVTIVSFLKIYLAGTFSRRTSHANITRQCENFDSNEIVRLSC